MKSFLLAVAALSLATGLSAQSYEVGLNAGLSTNTIPHSTLYSGKKTVWNKAAAVNFHYNLNEHWRAGGEIGITGWETWERWPISGAFGDSLNTEKVRIVLAQRAVSFVFQFNYVLPFYRPHEDFAWSNLYAGLSAGAVATGNDGKIIFSKVNANTPVEYTFAKEFHYERGYGYLVGFQVGYTYYFGQHVGVNLDIAPKMAWVSTVDSRYSEANNSFRLAYFPATLGVHYRFGYRRTLAQR